MSMTPIGWQPTYRSIFTPSTSRERQENFEAYWLFSLSHSGELFEKEKDLSKKREQLRYFREHPVRSRRPLPEPAAFYRSYLHLTDGPARLDRKTLLLLCIYKFARNEWVGVSGAWDAAGPMAQVTKVTHKISRYHLAEEFCHVRYFHEMFLTLHLDKIEWVPLDPARQRMYRIFPHLPGAIMDPPAFVTELMGVTFYRHVDRLLNDVFADEPEARDRIRALLYEIMVDELGHIGQRRNFLGPLGVRAARWLVKPVFRGFFATIGESKQLFDVDQMIRDGLAFDYSGLPAEVLRRSWIPSYCTVSRSATA